MILLKSIADFVNTLTVMSVSITRTTLNGRLSSTINHARIIRHEE